MSYPMPTPAQRDRQIENLLQVVETLRTVPVVTPCALCEQFEKDTGRCRRWSAVVPPDARDAGCPQWEEAIPF